MNKITQVKTLERVRRTFRPSREAMVFITPLNEGLELNYCESKTATAHGIVRRSGEIIDGLSSVLPGGSFSVRVEDPDDLECVFHISGGFVCDREFNRVVSIDELLEEVV